MKFTHLSLGDPPLIFQLEWRGRETFASFFKKGSYSANKFAGSEKIQIDWSKLISGYNGNLLMLYGDLENVDREASLEFTSIDEKFEDAIYNIKNYGHRVPVFIA
mgnify:CR=1 FL=1